MIFWDAPINRIEKVYQQLTSRGQNIRKLHFGSPQQAGIFFPPELITPCYQNYFARPTYDPDPQGLPAARVAIAQDYASQGWQIDPDRILITSGTSESFFYLFSLLAGQGGKILVPSPSYPLFEAIAALAKVSLAPYPLCADKNWQLDLDHLAVLLTDEVKAVVLISPHNPTGAVTSPDELHDLAALLAGHGAALICDEVFSDFYFGAGSYPRPACDHQFPLCFTLNGLSKKLALPAMKLGWVAVSGSDDDAVRTALSQLSFMADTLLACHTPIQIALPEILRHSGDFLSLYRRRVRAGWQELSALMAAQDIFSWTRPAGGFYALLRARRCLSVPDEEWVVELMQEKSLMVHPGYFYDDHRPGSFVLSFVQPEGVLTQGFEQLLHFFKNF